ncbi:MAG: heme o synthase [Gemmatimonadota bacterium]
MSKPGIAAGVAVAGLAGMVLAAGGLPDGRTAALGLGCIVAAASGAAIVNGLLDAPRDARMARLSGRVAALRTVGERGALALSLVLVASALAVSFLFLNAVAALFILAAVLSYSFLYTVCLKRRSPYGTIPGGVPGALPVLVGYAATGGRIGLPGLLLFLVMLLWQPPHFWILALKYQDDYRAAGIPAMPVARGEAYTRFLILLHAVALLPASLALWAFGGCSGLFAAAAALLWAYFILSCWRNAVAARRFGRAFAASIVYMMGLLAAVIVDVAAR